MISPLEPLHPDGRAAVVVHGAAGAPALESAPASARGDSGPGVVVLAPSRAERRRAEWVAEAARLAASVDRDGLVVAARPGRRLGAQLARCGLEPGAHLLHVPDVAGSRFVAPLRGPAARHAVGRLIPLSRGKRAGARLLGLPGVAALGPTTTIFRRAGARPLLQWLCAIEPAAESCHALVAGGWRPGGATVVHRFADARAAPDVLAKIGAGAAREVQALRSLGAAARVGPADVPRVVHEGHLGDVAVVVQTALPGIPASRVLEGSPRRVPELLREVAGWLEGWNATTAAPRSFGPADAERHLLEPAARLAALLDDADAYLARLRRLCERGDVLTIPRVAAHNDLTAANLLVDGRGGLGVVDWEEAEPQGLPLTDLAYAAVDFAAAADGYRDRPAAFAACFEAGGAHAGLTAQLLRRAGGALGLGEPALDVCLHACWLRHAENERRRADAEGSTERPFLAILRRAASRVPRP